MPVWSFCGGQVSVQRVLQYPVCLLVISDEYARFVGPITGLSTVEPRGTGWTCGTMLQPVDDEGLLVNEIVEYVEGDSDVHRVGQVCERFGLSERSLQRLTGLTPALFAAQSRA